MSTNLTRKTSDSHSPSGSPSEKKKLERRRSVGGSAKGSTDSLSSTRSSNKDGADSPVVTPIVRNRRHSASQVPALQESEEVTFLKVLDLLEAHDEFESTSSGASIDDADSTYSDETWEEESSDEDNLPMDPDEEPLAEWELRAAWMQLKNRKMPSIEIAEQMIRDVIRHYAEKPTLVHLAKPHAGGKLIIVGDLHGHFADFMHIIHENGEPEVDKSGRISPQYLFNGDFVDRGAYGPEVLLAIYCLKLLFPDGVFLNRGNHEDFQQNNKPDNGFCHSHCTRAWGQFAEEMYHLCYKSFKALPLCHILGREIAIVHGGLPLDSMLTLKEIEKIDRFHGVPVRQVGLLGYPKGQEVQAKKDMESEDGETIMKGTPGKIVHRVGKGNEVMVRFSKHVQAVVQIRGAPELEQEIQIMYKNKQAAETQRAQRTFVALLWSDPVEDVDEAGPSYRGAGAQFTKAHTQEFLKVNGLKLLIRSHEKQPDGFKEEHRNSKQALIAATVFSASNYPAGAGEPDGNKASIIVISADASGRMMPQFVDGWREPFHGQPKVGDVHLDGQLRDKVLEVTKELEQNRSPRVRVLAKIRNMIYAARPKLLSFWSSLDKEGTGEISRDGWIQGMRACLIPDDKFPWSFLSHFILHLDERGLCSYTSFVSRYENVMCTKLAAQWHSSALLKLAPGVETREGAQAAWARLDPKNDGHITCEHMAPMLRGVSGGYDQLAQDDVAFSVLTSMDTDHNGKVEEGEFVSAVMGLIERSTNRKVTLSNKRKITRLLESSDQSDVKACWAATQCAIRALAASMGSMAGVFLVLDGDGDGKLTRTEFEDCMTQLLHGSSLLHKIDRWSPILWQLVDVDGSGAVSAQELCSVFAVRDIVKL